MKLSNAVKEYAKLRKESLPFILEINGKMYKTIRDATNETGITFVTIKKRLGSNKYPEYKWL